jgi:putative transposase
MTGFLALEDGTVFRGEYAYLQKEKELKKVQQKLSSLSALTEGYRKTKAVLNHIYERIDNRRRNTTENISRYIADNYDTIAMEDLSVARLRRKSKDRWMTKRYNDVKLGELRRRIQDKAESAGCSVILVDPRGTSQICSGCGAFVKKDLSVRVHVCPVCGLNIDRDVNAARNILARALSQTPQGSAGDPRPGFVRAEKPAV